MENNNGNHQQPPQENEQLKSFWLKEMEGDLDFKNHEFPLARIKRIIKFDPDVTMIAVEAPILFSKACEMFVMDLAMRSWHYVQENKRITIQRSDIAAAVARTLIMDFLLDVVPEEEEPVAADADPVAMPDHDDGVLPPGMVIGTPVVGGIGMHAPVLSQMHAWPGAWTAAPGEGEDAAEGNGGNVHAAEGEGEYAAWIGF